MLKSKVEFRSVYQFDIDPGIDCSADGLAKQSFRDECDINNIMQKYVATGLLEHVNEREAVFDDFSGFDFARSMNVVAKAQEMFDNLPAEIRKRFQNDPVAFIEFVQDETNRDEAVKLGIVNKPAQSSSEAGSSPQAGSGSVGQAEGASGAAGAA